ncbi:TonB-dependent receptor plug domain-containing protein, partial [Sulfitobacter sp. CW3]|uniref:TonB-dependent receptor plug domain-containing protein n=1 Tax=Sulfitobacter sp. CW3 TaxID=2861965 RepID=UPI001C5DFA91
MTINAATLHAQEADQGFLGTLVLGESKRKVQTNTAVPQTTVDQDEIDDRQAGTVAELIDSVPGVSLVNGSTPQGSGINIRGFGANSTYGTDQKVAVQIDGANVGAEELYRIGTQLFTDPFLYKNVSVIRGTVGSFEYGSGIVGGVVRLETKDASDLTGGELGYVLGQTLGFSSNGNGLTSSTVLAWQPTQDMEFMLNYTWRDQDNQQDGNGDEIGNSAFTLPSGLLKAKYTFGENRDQSLT